MSQWHSDFNKLSPDLTRKELLELYLMVMVLILKKLIKTMDKIKAIEFLLFKFWLKRVMCSQFSHRKQSMLLG